MKPVLVLLQLVLKSSGVKVGKLLGVSDVSVGWKVKQLMERNGTRDEN